MYCETSYANMVQQEKDLWNSLIHCSCDLLDLLHKRDKSNYILAKYISVLFGFRSTSVDYQYLIDTVNSIYNSNGSGYDVDKFLLQKKIKDYLGNIDSTLDYLHKFLGELKSDKNKKLVNFDRKNIDFAEQINKMRNEVMHEGVTLL